MKTLTKVLLIVLVSYFVAAANGASFEVFLKIEGIQGDSKDARHQDWINAVSFNIGASNSGTFAGGGGSGAGKAEFTDLKVFKFIDKASPALFISSAQGDHIQSATLEVRTPEGFLFYRIVLDHVLVSSVNDDVRATDENGEILEVITLNWTRITWTIFPRDAAGRPTGPITKWFDRASVKGG